MFLHPRSQMIWAPKLQIISPNNYFVCSVYPFYYLSAVICTHFLHNLFSKINNFSPHNLQIAVPPCSTSSHIHLQLSLIILLRFVHILWVLSREKVACDINTSHTFTVNWCAWLCVSQLWITSWYYRLGLATHRSSVFWRLSEDKSLLRMWNAGK